MICSIRNSERNIHMMLWIRVTLYFIEKGAYIVLQRGISPFARNIRKRYTVAGVSLHTNTMRKGKQKWWDLLRMELTVSHAKKYIYMYKQLQMWQYESVCVKNDNLRTFLFQKNHSSQCHDCRGIFAICGKLTTWNNTHVIYLSTFWNIIMNLRVPRNVYCAEQTFISRKFPI